MGRPAIAGTMETSSPSLTWVFSLCLNRMSSSFIWTFQLRMV
jgi:hypothetical protein